MTPIELNSTALVSQWRGRTGLVPISLNTEGHVIWRDLGRYHCYEGFFNQSLSLQSHLVREVIDFSCPLSFLTSAESPFSPDSLADQCLQPTGFIFHPGRSGSTILAKLLAKSRRNLVLSEAAPHNQIWKFLPQASEPGSEMYRRLLLLTGRKRLPSYTSYFVKFTSFNIMKYEAIRSAFPHVPALFLYREPSAILASYGRNAPAWLGRAQGIGVTWNSVDSAVEDYFNAALKINDRLFHCMSYSELKPEALSAILRYFGSAPDDDELRLMLSEFGWDAKSGLIPAPFRPVQFENCRAPEHLNLLWERLRSHNPLL